MLRLRAPAKVNLYLRVVGKRPDGYHEIETVFERIDLADELTFEEQSQEITLTCTEPTLSCGDENLILKAARLLQHTGRTNRGVRIHLTKRIPIAAGLGGGSSDAAATLLGLNALWGLELEPQELIRLSARLGSDVPFFLGGDPFAIGRGRGEVCETLQTTRRLAHVLVCPNVPLSTKAIYESAQFDLTAPKPSLTMVTHALSNGSLGELAHGLWNDLEPEAIRRCPVITRIQSQLLQLGCMSAHVSGSGPSVFGLCRDFAHAQDVAAQLQTLSPSSWRVEPIQTDGASCAVTSSRVM